MIKIKPCKTIGESVGMKSHRENGPEDFQKHWNWGVGVTQNLQEHLRNKHIKILPGPFLFSILFFNVTSSGNCFLILFNINLPAAIIFYHVQPNFKLKTLYPSKIMLMFTFLLVENSTIIKLFIGQDSLHLFICCVYFMPRNVPVTLRA